MSATLWALPAVALPVRRDFRTAIEPEEASTCGFVAGAGYADRG